MKIILFDQVLSFIIIHGLTVLEEILHQHLCSRLSAMYPHIHANNYSLEHGAYIFGFAPTHIFGFAPTHDVNI